MIQALLGFTVVSIIVVVTPGPDTMIVLRFGVGGGRRAGVWAAVGAAAGSLAWGVLAGLGLAAVLQRWDLAYTIIRLAGATYLIYLGFQALLQRSHSPGAANDPDDTHSNTTESRPASLPVQRPAPDARFTTAQAARTGLLSDLLNPKQGLFFVAVAPQFIPPGYPPLEMTMSFAAIDATIAVLWLTLLGGLAAHSARWLGNQRTIRRIERGTGAVLIGLGITAAVETR